MKPKITPKFLAMMAACAVVTNGASIGAARAEGMPAQAQQLIQTMRPMQMSQATPGQEQTQAAATPAQQANDSAYGGTMAGSGASASGGRPGGCSDKPRCDIFFGQ